MLISHIHIPVLDQLSLEYHCIMCSEFLYTKEDQYRKERVDTNE